MPRPKKQGNFHFLNVQIPDNILNKLSEYSEQTRIPKNAITEMALEEYLEKNMNKKSTENQD